MIIENELKLLPSNSPFFTGGTNTISGIEAVISKAASFHGADFAFQDTLHILDVYYDTTQLDLYRLERTVRIRHCDGQKKIIIKESPSIINSFLQRNEYCKEIDTDDDMEYLKNFYETIFSEPLNVSSVLSINLQRSQYTLFFESEKYELCLDQYTYCGKKTSMKATTNYEIEIEALETQKPNHVENFLRSLINNCGFQTTSKSKFERGLSSLSLI